MMDTFRCKYKETPEPQQVPGSGGGGWGIRTPEGLHPTRFPSVRHRPLGESSVHIVPDNHKRQKAFSANPGQWSRSQHLAESLHNSANQVENPRTSDENPVENEGRDGFTRTDAAGQALRLHEGDNREDNGDEPRKDENCKDADLSLIHI